MSSEIPAQKFLFRVATEVKKEAKRVAPVDTRNLRRDIRVFDDNIKNLEIAVGNSTLAPYAKYVHEGTGLYGKHKRRITPKKKKALKTSIGSAGQKPQPYLQDAAKSVLSGSKCNSIVDSFAHELGDALVKDIKQQLKSPNITIN